MDRDQAIAKIKKCLALGRSAEPHEASAALRQAQKLMDAFAVSEQDISLADIREVKVKARTGGSAWEVRLAKFVADAFGCERYSEVTGSFNASGSYVKKRFAVFVGFEPPASVAGYAFEVLGRQCATARAQHVAQQPKSCKPMTRTTRGDAFAMGWVSAVSELIERFAQAESRTLLIETYMQVNHADLITVTAKNRAASKKVDRGHFLSGMAAGKQAELARGVGGVAERDLLS